MGSFASKLIKRQIKRSLKFHIEHEPTAIERKISTLRLSICEMETHQYEPERNHDLMNQKQFELSTKIESPLDFIYFMYASSGSKHKTFKHMNEIDTKNQIEIIRKMLFYKTGTIPNINKFTKPFIDLGMEQLTNYESASVFYCMLLKFIKDYELFKFDGNYKDNSFKNWDQFHISRSLFFPINKFIHLFEKQNVSLNSFIYDLCQWVIQSQYDFKSFHRDFVKHPNDFAKYIIKCVYPNISETAINPLWPQYLNECWSPIVIHKRIYKYNINHDNHWKLIFRQKLDQQKSINSLYFEPNQYIKNYGDPSNPVYSILDAVNFDDFRDINRNLCFMLLWPGITKFDSNHNCEGIIWYQTSIPLSSNDVDGYKPIFVPYPGIKSNSFCGLNKAKVDNKNGCNVLCKGCKQDKDNWFSIGLCDKWQYKEKIGIPGPMNVCVQCTELYVFDIKSVLKEFIERLMIDNDWMSFEIGKVIVQMIYDKTYVIKYSLNKLYPLPLDQ